MELTMRLGGVKGKNLIQENCLLLNFTYGATPVLAGLLSFSHSLSHRESFCKTGTDICSVLIAVTLIYAGMQHEYECHKSWGNVTELPGEWPSWKLAEVPQKGFRCILMKSSFKTSLSLLSHNCC